MNDEPMISYAMLKQKYRVYRERGTGLEYIDMVHALDVAGAAREAVKKHHDWRNDGLEWKVVVIAADAFRPVTVTFEPQAKVA